MSLALTVTMASSSNESVNNKEAVDASAPQTPPAVKPLRISALLPAHLTWPVIKISDILAQQAAKEKQAPLVNDEGPYNKRI